MLEGWEKLKVLFETVSKAREGEREVGIYKNTKKNLKFKIKIIERECRGLSQYTKGLFGYTIKTYGIILLCKKYK